MLTNYNINLVISSDMHMDCRMCDAEYSSGARSGCSMHNARIWAIAFYITLHANARRECRIQNIYNIQHILS